MKKPSKRGFFRGGASGFLTLALILSLLPAALAADAGTHFSDVPAEYSLASDIQRAESLGLVQGYPNGTFGPTEPLTRQAFMLMVMRAYVKAGAYNPTQSHPEEGPRDGLDDAFYFMHDGALANGNLSSTILNLLDNRLQTATRGDAVAILDALVPASVTYSESWEPFTDASLSEMIAINRVNGGHDRQTIVRGFADGTVRLGSPLNRAQGTAWALRLYDLLMGSDRTFAAEATEVEVTVIDTISETLGSLRAGLTGSGRQSWWYAGFIREAGEYAFGSGFGDVTLEIARSTSTLRLTYGGINYAFTVFDRDYTTLFYVDGQKVVNRQLNSPDSFVKWVDELTGPYEHDIKIGKDDTGGKTAEALRETLEAASWDDEDIIMTLAHYANAMDGFNGSVYITERKVTNGTTQKSMHAHNPYHHTAFDLYIYVDEKDDQLVGWWSVGATDGWIGVTAPSRLDTPADAADFIRGYGSIR